jgi:hypothetical protein
MKEHFPPGLWIYARDHFEECRQFFEAFIPKPPDSLVFIESLIFVARVNLEAMEMLALLAKLRQCAEVIVQALPLNNRQDGTMLLNIYKRLLNHDGLGEIIYRQEEFYIACMVLADDGERESLNTMSRLLRDDRVELSLVKKVGFFDVFSRLVLTSDDSDVLWVVLSVIHKWSSQQMIPEFECLLERMGEMLCYGQPAVRLGSFLCLIVFSSHFEGRIDKGQMIVMGVKYVVEGTDVISNLSYDFLTENQQAIAANLIAYIDLFLRCVKGNGKWVAKTAKLFRRVAHKFKIELEEEIHDSLVRFSHM